MTKILYMGTPAFAVPALTALVEAGHQVVAVFCQPDRPKGRSGRPQPCPVKAEALRLGLPVHQPVRLRNKKWVELVRELAPELILVAAFGQILPPAMLEIPQLGCLNLHASLLPRWRGASPIHQAILAGDHETGICLMRMEEGLDTGPVYRRTATPIGAEETRPQLETRLARIAAELLLETLPHLPSLHALEQGEAGVTYAPIIQREAGRCRFSEQSASEIARMVRAFAEWPEVYALFRGTPLKLQAVRPLGQKLGLEPGQIAKIGKKGFAVACKDGDMLEVLQLQPAGKKSMDALSFLNGNRLNELDRLETP